MGSTEGNSFTVLRQFEPEALDDLEYRPKAVKSVRSEVQVLLVNPRRFSLRNSSYVHEVLIYQRVEKSTVVVHVERLVLIEETMVYSCKQGVVLDHWKEGSRWEHEKKNGTTRLGVGSGFCSY